MHEAEPAAQALRFTMQAWEVDGPEGFERVFAALTAERPDALYVAGSPLMLANRKRIVDFALQSRLPAVYEWREAVEDGGLMSYGTSNADLSRRAATYVDKILKGAKPADLPIEQPRKFELVLNLKTAKALGITIPPSLLLLADEVIQ
jgi:putative ABC transport system substrate-binding protein